MEALVEETGADELIVVCDVYDHAERLRSIELIARRLRSDADGGCTLRQVR